MTDYYVQPDLLPFLSETRCISKSLGPRKVSHRDGRGPLPNSFKKRISQSIIYKIGNVRYSRINVDVLRRKSHTFVVSVIYLFTYADIKLF